MNNCTTAPLAYAAVSILVERRPKISKTAKIILVLITIIGLEENELLLSKVIKFEGLFLVSKI